MSRIDVAVVAAWRRAGDGTPLVLVTRRADRGHLAGLWELPGGRIEAGEEALEAARRELSEETSLEVDGATALGVFEHDYGDRFIRLHGFIGEVTAEVVEITLDGPVDHRWVTPGELPGLPLPAGNAPLTRLVVDHLGAV